MTAALLLLSLAACSPGSMPTTGPGAPGDDIDEGTTTTAWYTGVSHKPDTVPGTWRVGGPSPDHADFRLVRETAHFAFYSDEALSPADLDSAASTLEDLVWTHLFDTDLVMPEPFSDRAEKIKAAVHVHSDWGLTGGSWVDGQGRLHMGLWIGPGALADHWGLTHEFTHAWQAWATYAGGLACDVADTCGWIHESHANFTPHQLPEYASNVHCTEMLVNAPQLYLGSSRDRYCNWQVMEFLKDKYGPEAVTQIWTTPGSDPLQNLQRSRGWTLSQLNDFIGDWAMHNVTWDYHATPAAFRDTYGDITRTDRAERLHRLMPLEALDDAWSSDRRFVAPLYGAPQRFGYNVVRLYPSAGASTVSVTFRGVDQPGSDADFRWGLVATDAGFTRARYSALQHGLDGALTFRVHEGEPLFLVVVATPTVFQSITWDQDYHSIWRYPYMVSFDGAWPQGFRDGRLDDCPVGTARHANGGGCAPSTTPASVFVGPYATVLPGAHASGAARIEDEAVVANGSVSGGIVGGLTVVGTSVDGGGGNAFDVSGQAVLRTSFYPLGFFEPGQGASGTVTLYGDVEYRGAGLNLSSGVRSGFVDATSTVGSKVDINSSVRPNWRGA